MGLYDNGGIIGNTNRPTLSTASGVWGVRQQARSRRDDVWPRSLIVTDGLQVNLDAANPNSYSGTGTVWFDLSGNNANATLTGTGYTSSNGGGIVFGSGDVGTISSGKIDFSGGGFTASLWIRHTGVVSIARVQRYFTIGGEALVLRHDNSSAASLRTYFVDSGGTLRSIDVSDQIFSGNYYNVTATYDGTTYRLFRNNSQVGSLVGSFTLKSALAVELGSGSEFFEGDMYAVHFYNRALSTAELTANYNALKSRYGL
jgi:hypothetical protein